MIEWSTDGVRVPERFSYWREMVCQTVFNISIEAPPGPFSARLAARSAGPLRIVSGESSAYELVRTRREVDGAPSDHYCIYLQRRGEGIINQCGESLTYRPDDIAISDLKLPFRAFHADGGRRVVAVIPCALLDQRAPWMRQTALRRLDANAPFVDLARRHMLEMAQSPVMSETAMALLAENLCNLLALASASGIAPSRMQPELQIEAMIAFCRQNFHDTELAPQRVADYLGVSVRTLHLRFKQIGQTFGRWLLEERLKACGVALRDENQRGLNISDIAYRMGFNDLSHFNKAFRARFGMSPREWRMSRLS